jgi:hypothetical protein
VIIKSLSFIRPNVQCQNDDWQASERGSDQASAEQGKGSSIVQRFSMDSNRARATWNCTVVTRCSWKSLRRNAPLGKLPALYQLRGTLEVRHGPVGGGGKARLPV